MIFGSRYLLPPAHFKIGKGSPELFPIVAEFGPNLFTSHTVSVTNDPHSLVCTEEIIDAQIFVVPLENRKTLGQKFVVSADPGSLIRRLSSEFPRISPGMPAAIA